MSGTGALFEASPSPSWTGYAPLDAATSVRLQAAVVDVREGLRRWRGWTYLATEMIKNQYRRTVLGPWWLTLQTAAYVVALAVVFGQILGTPLHSFLPYVAIGFIGFTLLSGVTRAASVTFVGAAGIMKSTRQPLSCYALRDLTIEFILFGHNMVIYLVFLAAGMVPLSPRILIAAPVIVLIAVNGFLLALWLGPLAARYRDVGPLVASVLQVLVFFTPIFYRLNDLGDKAELLDWNPFTYFLGALRAPLIGTPLRASDYIGVLVITVFNAGFGLRAFSRTRSWLPYWVA